MKVLTVCELLPSGEVTWEEVPRTIGPYFVMPATVEEALAMALNHRQLGKTAIWIEDRERPASGPTIELWSGLGLQNRLRLP